MKNFEATKAKVLDHWQTILLLALAGEYDSVEDIAGPNDCPFCMIFNFDTFDNDCDDCVGCPISERVKDIHCKETPYIDVDELLLDSEFDRDNIDQKELIDAICKEIKFLESLENTQEE
jgi:hypothetical protein